jgi:protein-S-isoprenylcysteine O-methyltransferase Ste14
VNRIAELSRVAIPALWIAWLALWVASAANVKRTQWREPRAGALANRLPVLLGAAMLASAGWLPPLLTRRLVSGAEAPDLGMLLVAAGLAFSVWARWHLGRNWSSTVTVKQDHSLIRSGPYRFVRHPIYSGMLLALLGTALAIGEARGFVGAALILVGFVVKLRVEEARMRETFPEYAEYCRHTARLVPGVF